MGRISGNNQRRLTLMYIKKCSHVWPPYCAYWLLRLFPKDPCSIREVEDERHSGAITPDLPTYDVLACCTATRSLCCMEKRSRSAAFTAFVRVLGLRHLVEERRSTKSRAATFSSVRLSPIRTGPSFFAHDHVVGDTESARVRF